MKMPRFKPNLMPKMTGQMLAALLRWSRAKWNNNSVHDATAAVATLTAYLVCGLTHMGFSDEVI